MREKYISYRWLLRIVGMILFFGAFFFAFSIAMIPSGVNGDPHLRPLILMNLSQTLFLFLRVGIIFYLLAAGLILWGVSIRRSCIAYWAVQGALWLIGIALWYQSNNTFDPFPTDATWIIITTVLSFVLLIAYPLVILALKRVTRFLTQRKVQVKEELSWTDREPPLQEQGMYR